MTNPVRVLALGDAGLRDALMGKGSGGAHLDAGLSDVVTKAHPDYQLAVEFADVGSLATFPDTIAQTDVVVLSAKADVAGLDSGDPEAAVAAFRDNLISTFDRIKDQAGAHVLVVNTSTFDPNDETSSLYGLTEEPTSMRSHRINLALLKASHELGLSIIDVDRITAEAGCGNVVPAALELTPQGSALVRDETARVLEDYGFFDERSVVEQVGNRGGGK